MSLPVVIFTFSLDGPSAVEAVLSAWHCGLGPVYLFEERARPLGPLQRELLLAKGARIIATDFKRGGSLNGSEALDAMAECYLRVLDETGARRLVKLDSDTVLNRVDRIWEAERELAALAGGSDSVRPIFGGCMVISRSLVLAMLGRARLGNQADVAEDKATFRIAVESSLDVIQWPYSPQGGFFAGWRYREMKQLTLADYASRFDVVTFGNRHLIDHQPGCGPREIVTLTMAKFRRTAGQDTTDAAYLARAVPVDTACEPGAHKLVTG